MGSSSISSSFFSGMLLAPISSAFIKLVRNGFDTSSTEYSAQSTASLWLNFDRGVCIRAEARSLASSLLNVFPSLATCFAFLNVNITGMSRRVE